MPPRHLALIPDGNRRWARRRGLGATEGHAAGMATMAGMLEAAWAAGVEVCTFWWGSPANLRRRDPQEVAGIVGTLGRWLAEVAPGLLARNDAAFAIVGDWERLCPELRPGVEAARAAAGRTRQLVVLMAYDGCDEIRAAVAASGGSVEAFERALWMAPFPPVDLVVRAAGEPHLSAGFLLWWVGEAQLAFPAAPWPDLGPADLRRILADYDATPRRFGR